MELNIDKDQAIKILRQRLNEIDEFDFNPRAWKDKTENDLRQIFPLGSMQWLQISNVNFETFIETDKLRVFNLGRDTARKLIGSYIEFIQVYSKASEQAQLIKNDSYEQKYHSLLAKWNEIVPGYKELVEKYDRQIKLNDSKNIELQQIKNDSIQLNDVSFNKLIKVFSNLPVKQIFATLGILTAILVGCFTLGLKVQENIDNTKMVDIKTEKNQLAINISVLKNSITEKDAQIANLNAVTKLLRTRQLVGPGFNQIPDMATLTIANDTQLPCYGGAIDGCWKDSVTANGGDTIGVQVYYKNSTIIPAKNTTISIKPESSQATHQLIFSGGVASLSMQRSIGYAILSLPTAKSVKYVPGTAIWYPSDRKKIPLTETDNLFGQAGFDIGTVNPGEQGVLVANFVVLKN